MIAFHFPPLAGSSGIQRTLRFVQHLPSLEWQPLVLTAHQRAYERTSDDLLGEVPLDTVVRHAFALDTARHLQIAGRYLGSMARPDRWISWRFDGVRQGLSVIRDFKPDVIWSTYPIASAHVIAAELHRKTGIPWVADFRDPMAHEGFPADPLTWQSYLAIEADVAALAHCCVFTTPGALRMYQKRYPSAANRMVVLENGYDEDSFLSAASTATTARCAPADGGPLVILHSGIVYQSERDPTQLFLALARLRDARLLTPQDIRFRFRASGNDAMVKSLATSFGIADFIELRPAIPYREALAEMMNVDALLVLQASNCNDQIPAKVYEYLRAGKPILALTDPVGDTAGVLLKAGLHSMARLDSVEEIFSILPTFMHSLRKMCAELPHTVAVREATRRRRSEDFAQLLNTIQ